MAQRVQILLEDDLDGSEAAETVNFAVDGVSYEIDLSAANAAKLRDDVARWVGHARRVRGRRQTAPRTTAGRPDLGKVREWARDNGFTVSDRGRVSAKVQEAYAKANG
ncbi:histone-like nucleoid-structuring protein Lsr2 [Leekyejoonella antrihumi]|uniref:Lsr2 family protein n=1 Tax=Leekyejoonella antrihumi TaxID=1660198 RepID=A0A563DXP8_9MICO|nr:Lsr2 family protein [Leekyejoonella antrihumi]TWP34732.1 Lsr2 family protein [Leekyejoonella antrihumi]